MESVETTTVPPYHVSFEPYPVDPEQSAGKDIRFQTMLVVYIVSMVVILGAIIGYTYYKRTVGKRVGIPRSISQQLSLTEGENGEAKVKVTVEMVEVGGQHGDNNSEKVTNCNMAILIYFNLK